MLINDIEHIFWSMGCIHWNPLAWWAYPGTASKTSHGSSRFPKWWSDTSYSIVSTIILHWQTPNSEAVASSKQQRPSFPFYFWALHFLLTSSTCPCVCVGSSCHGGPVTWPNGPKGAAGCVAAWVWCQRECWPGILETRRIKAIGEGVRSDGFSIFRSKSCQIHFFQVIERMFYSF